jgi:hypothetical protein
VKEEYWTGIMLLAVTTKLYHSVHFAGLSDTDFLVLMILQITRTNYHKLGLKGNTAHN